MNVILLGSSGGIGNELVNVLSSKKNHNLYCFQRKKSKIKIQNNCKYFYGDLNDEKIFKKNLSQIGKNIKFDALVSNFGITKQQKTRDIKEQNNIFLENINTNLISTFNKINTCINIIKFKKNISSFVLISSLSAHLGFPNNPGYAASKGGINSLVRSLMKDYMNEGFRFNSISPGYVKTNMTVNTWKNKKKFIEKQIPLGRWGKPKEIANVIYFLISNYSSYINGQDIIVDGGWSKNSFYNS